MSMINDEAVAAIKTGENSTEEKAESAMPSMPGAGARSLLNHPSMPQMPEPTLKAIIEEIDSGSRRAVKRYWNNREVLKKLAVDMHLAVNEGHTVTALDRISGADIVHNPASVVDLEGPSGSPRSAKRLCNLGYWNDKEVLIKLGVAINLAVTKDCTVEALEGIPGTDSVHQTASVDDVEMEFAQVRLDAGATVDALGPHKQKVAAFAAAVVQIYLDNAGDLGLIAKRIKSSNLDFTEFGDIFFEVVFTGGRIQPGTMKPNDWERHTYSVLDCEAKSEILLPSVIYIKEILRHKGFLTLNFRNIMQRFLGSLAYFEDNERLKLAIFTALAFSHKLPLLPETVFQPLLENDLVEKGFSLRFIADLFQEYLNKKNFNSLISIWKRGKVEDFFQFIRFEVRSAEDLSMRLFIAGMEDLVDFCDKINLEKFKAALATQISEIPVLIETSRRQAKDAKSVLIETSRKHAILVLIETSRRHAKDAGMPEKILLGVIMEVLTSDSDRWRGDVNKFERYVYSQVKPQWDLLKELCTTEVLQQELMNILQQYPPSLFCKLVRWLKSKSVISDCVILEWSYHRETQVKHLMSLKYIVIQLQDEEEDRVQRDLCSAQKRYEATKRQNPSSLISSPLIRITQHRCTTLSYSMRVNYLCHPADIDFPDPRYFS